MRQLQSLQYCVCPLDGTFGKVIVFNVFYYMSIVRKQTSCFVLMCIMIALQQCVSHLIIKWNVDVLPSVALCDCIIDIGTHNLGRKVPWIHSVNYVWFYLHVLCKELWNNPKENLVTCEAQSSPCFTFPLCLVPGVRGVMSSSVPGSGDSSGSESSPGVSGASAEPQPNGGGPCWLNESRRQTRWLLPAIWCGEWFKSLFKTNLFKHSINK